MATLVEVQGKLNAINAAIDAKQVEILAGNDSLKAEIAALQAAPVAQVAQLVSQADLDGLAASADSIAAHVQTIGVTHA